MHSVDNRWLLLRDQHMPAEAPIAPQWLGRFLGRRLMTLGADDRPAEPFNGRGSAGRRLA